MSPQGKSIFEAKKLKGIGIATAERHPWLPDLPTLKEQGVDVEYALYRGIYVPVGTPQPIVEKLEDVFQKVAQNPEFVKKIGDLGSLVQFSGQKEFKDITAQDIQSYTMLAEMIGMKKEVATAFGKQGLPLLSEQARGPELSELNP